MSRQPARQLVFLHILLIATFAWLQAHSSVVHAEEPLDLTTVLARYQAACEEAAAYDVLLNYVHTFPDQPAKARYYQLRQRQDGTRYRCDVLLDDGQPYAEGEFASSFDGQRQYSLMAQQQTAMISPVKVLPALLHPAVRYRMTMSHMGTGQGTYLDLIRRNPQATATQIHEGLIVINAPVTAGTLGLRLTLDPQRGYLPLGIDYLTFADDEAHPTPQVAWRIENTLEEVLPGRWMPVSFRLVNYCLHEDVAPLGSVLSQVQYDIELASSSFTTPVSDTAYALTIPTGITVLDGRESLRTFKLLRAEMPRGCIQCKRPL